METRKSPHPFAYRRLCFDLLGAVFFCRKLRMLITIANVPLMHPHMLHMASTLFTVSPPFIVFIIPHISVVVNAFLQSFQDFFDFIICIYRNLIFHFWERLIFLF